MYSLKLTAPDIRQSVTQPIEFEITLTQKELKAVPNVKSVEELYATFTTYEVENDYVVHVEVEGKINIIDHITTKLTSLEIKDSEDVTISDDAESTDIVFNQGSYEFYPTVLALFYAAVPVRYSSKDVDFQEKDTYTYMTEDKYEVTHEVNDEENESSTPNPLKKLDPKDFE